MQVKMSGLLRCRTPSIAFRRSWLVMRTVHNWKLDLNIGRCERSRLSLITNETQRFGLDLLQWCRAAVLPSSAYTAWRMGRLRRWGWTRGLRTSFDGRATSAQMILFCCNSPESTRTRGSDDTRTREVMQGPPRSAKCSQAWPAVWSLTSPACLLLLVGFFKRRLASVKSRRSPKLNGPRPRPSLGPFGLPCSGATELYSGATGPRRVFRPGCLPTGRARSAPPPLAVLPFAPLRTSRLPHRCAPVFAVDTGCAHRAQSSGRVGSKPLTLRPPLPGPRGGACAIGLRATESVPRPWKRGTGRAPRHAGRWQGGKARRDQPEPTRFLLPSYEQALGHLRPRSLRRARTTGEAPGAAPPQQPCDHPPSGWRALSFREQNTKRQMISSTTKSHWAAMCARWTRGALGATCCASRSVVLLNTELFLSAGCPACPGAVSAAGSAAGPVRDIQLGCTAAAASWPSSPLQRRPAAALQCYLE